MMNGKEVEGIKGSNMHTSFQCEEKTHFLSNMITMFGSPSWPSPSAPWLRGWVGTYIERLLVIMATDGSMQMNEAQRIGSARRN